MVLLAGIGCGDRTENPGSTGSGESPIASSQEGFLDTSFGGDGVVLQYGELDPKWDTTCRAMTLDAMGRTVAVGDTAWTGLDQYRHGVAWRFNTNGRLDPTFGGTGIVFPGHAGNGSGYPSCVTLDAKGRILAGGFTFSLDPARLHSKDFTVWRLNPDGSPDETLNGVGSIVLHDIGGGNSADFCADIAVAPDGKIVAVGNTYTPVSFYDSAAFVCRFTEDGILDAGFDGDGIAVINDTGGALWAYDLPWAVALDSQGRIISAGRTSSPQTGIDLCIVRHLPDGSLDPEFGGKGFVIDSGLGAVGMTDEALAVAVDDQDRIVAGGYTTDSAGGKLIALWRYDGNGTPDSSFDGDGFLTWGTGSWPYGTGSLAVLGRQIYTHGMKIDSAGRIVLSGMAAVSGSNYSGEDVLLLRYDSGGSLDTTFGRSGTLLVPGVSPGGYGTNEYSWGGLALTEDGRFVTGGICLNVYSRRALFLYRLTESGLDTSFDSDGFAESGWGQFDYGRGVAITSTGRILVAGYRTYNSYDDMLVRRYNIDGTPDLTFGTDGVAGALSSAPWHYLNDQALALSLDGQGRILMTGTNDNIWYGNTNMILWRYSADGVLDTTLNSAGFVIPDWTTAGLGNERGRAVTVGPDGTILIAGERTQSSGSTDAVLWRYSDTGILLSKTVIGAGRGWAIALDSNPHILIAGQRTDGAGNRDAVVWRRAPDGTPLDEFVYDGGSDDLARAIAVDTAGRILLAGEARNESANLDLFLCRFASDGTLETVRSVDGGAGDDRATAIAIDSTGRIVVTGSTAQPNGGTKMVLLRLLPDLSLDASFGSSGQFLQQASMRGKEDVGDAMTVTASGEIFVAGHSLDEASYPHMIVWKVK